MIRFYRTNGQGDDVWLYAMEIDGKVIARDLTIDQVVEAINRRDEESLGTHHTPGTREESHTGFAGAELGCVARQAARRDAPFRQGGQRGGNQNDPV